MIGYRAKEPNLRTNEHVCDVIEKTVVDDSEKSADRLGAPRSCLLSRARFLSVSSSSSHIHASNHAVRRQSFVFPPTKPPSKCTRVFPHRRISAARLRFSSSLQLLVAVTSSFHSVSVREIVREGSALQQMVQLPRHFFNS